MKILNNIVDSYIHIPYTIHHYIAFLKLEKQLIGYYKYKFHDLDKVLMYLFLPFLGTSKIGKIHRRINKHHIMDSKDPIDCNYEEAVIDWECARFTKPDKPLTALEIVELKKFKKIHTDNLLYVISRFLLNNKWDSLNPLSNKDLSLTGESAREFNTKADQDSENPGTIDFTKESKSGQQILDKANRLH